MELKSNNRETKNIIYFLELHMILKKINNYGINLLNNNYNQNFKVN